MSDLSNTLSPSLCLSSLSSLIPLSCLSLLSLLFYYFFLFSSLLLTSFLPFGRPFLDIANVRFFRKDHPAPLCTRFSHPTRSYHPMRQPGCARLSLVGTVAVTPPCPLLNFEPFIFLHSPNFLQFTFYFNLGVRLVCLY